jgi:heme/copper-type cytochrome/quinol oxidase subunit 1
VGSGKGTREAVLHSIARRYIWTAFAFLVIGLALGLYALALREVTGGWPGPYLVSAHTHALLVGFMMFMILGVALWIFPRPAKDDARYHPRMTEIVYWLLTIGTAGRIGGEVGRDAGGPVWLRWVVLTTGTLQVVALALFVWAIRARIRAVGSGMREAKGERF